MTNEEIRKLLGGYATNTLSESERTILFDAALEDQELFDALQKEQPLKELLASPVARAEIRQALDRSAPKAAWWSRWWTWTGLAGAVAATVVLFGVLRPVGPAITSQPALVASKTVPQDKIASAVPASRDSELKSKVEPSRPQENDRMQTSRRAYQARSEERLQKKADVPAAQLKDESAPSAPASLPPPPPVVTAQTEAVQSNAAASPKPSQQLAQQGHLGQAPASAAQAQNQAAPMAVSGFRAATDATVAAPEWTKQLTAGANAIQSNYTNGPLLRYSLIRPDASAAAADGDLKAGDVVQLNVSPGVSGFLALYELDSAGDWRRTYPVSTPGIPVMANTSYAIPDAPIRVPASPGKLRLVLAPAGSQFGAGLMSERADVKAKRAKEASKVLSLEKRQELGGALVVDVAIAPKK